ncbi:AAA family ATPase, partial [bacterium]|nr:AAA family ATPase [bacterium]
MRLDKRELKKRINSVLCRDRYSLQRQSRKLPEEDNENFSKQLHLLEEKLNNSRERVISRQSSIPALNYPAELPITSKLSDIVHTIQNNQVIVITGETGSGKTTQIPKMCLEAGRGIFGKICCTQPRRIAATSLAEQVAKELKTDLGEVIGFKIRFADKTQDSTLIQFMTDGILLAEIQRDRFLNDYDTIIIDEAHERTLNIDFLLGYLKQLLPRRPELKLVITSATIDVEKFSAAFPQYYDPQQEQSFLFKQSGRDLEVEKKGAPIIEVSGRMYPVELRYHPIDEKMEEQGDLTMIDLVKEAVEELLTETSTGDILVFMSGVQEIG